MSLTLDAIREANLSRTPRWHGPGWLTPEDPWSLADWANAMQGESGEAGNIVKKLRRIEAGMWDSQLYPGDSTAKLAMLPSQEAHLRLIEKLADEIADTILYADLLAAKAGIDLTAAVRRKFNRVSEAQGFPERL